MRLLLDEMIGPAVAGGLRHRGLDVVAVVEEAELRSLPDQEVLEHAAEQSRVLVTRNIDDFARLDARWRADGRHHQGLVMVTERAFPQDRDLIGALVRALLAAHQRRELPEADEIVFLSADRTAS